MKKKLIIISFIVVAIVAFCCTNVKLPAAPDYSIGKNSTDSFNSTYLNPVKAELEKQWPDNRTINIVFHGHSVPSGYGQTPIVNTLAAYPHRTLEYVKSRYPYAVVNVITTSIGGENAEQGAKRFESEVLCHRPDVLFIDYAVNDRWIGLDKAMAAWETMIKAAIKNNVKVVLMTPTPDMTEDLMSDDSLLAKHAAAIRALASKYSVALVDSYSTFREAVKKGTSLNTFMAQSNHPNERGHQLVLEQIKPLF